MLALLPGPYPVLRHLQYAFHTASGEMLDESLGTRLSLCCLDAERAVRRGGLSLRVPAAILEALNEL